MEIIIGKTAGFCFGVQNAVSKTVEQLNKANSIYCLGELVHNKQVTNELIEKGVKFIDNIEEAKNKVIIRAHGIPKEIYQIAKELKLEVIDLTCPKVLHTHKLAEEYANKGYFIILTGKINHPETIGTMSFCGDNYFVIEEEKELEQAIEKFRNSSSDKLLLISQTTYSMENFRRISKNLQEKIASDKLEIKNTICSATQQRQEETEEISKQVDLMIIVGGKHSSNTTKLYETADKHCKNVLFIETAEEVDIKQLVGIKKIGIMAGASTHKKSIEQVVEKIQKIC